MAGRGALRIAFVHPDLGIGTNMIMGIVLISRGSREIGGKCRQNYATAWSPEELKVSVHGDFLPRHLFGMFHIVFAALRSLYLALYIYIFIPFHYDVIVVDQISYSIPILKYCADKILFYCHFPDKFLSPKSTNPFRLSYRMLFDRWEEQTILKADKVVVNSAFTAQKFIKAFPTAVKPPTVLYPGISMLDNGFLPPKFNEIKFSLPDDSFFILSLNRFERKKSIGLAIRAFSWLEKAIDPAIMKKVYLIIAGGYDMRVNENAKILTELQVLCDRHNIEHSIAWKGKLKEGYHTPIIFMPSISDRLRDHLLSTALCLIYTPSNEHFGIVPIEAMSRAIPVIAVNNGGPKETIIDGVTGFLCQPTPESVGAKVLSLLSKEVDIDQMKVQAREHVKKNFSLEIFGAQFEKIAQELLL